MTSPSNVPKHSSKTRKFAWWHILLFTALLLLLLLFLFPKQLLIKSLINNPNPSALSIIYLRNLAALQPQNMELKLALAEQELKLGNVSNTANIIAPYITLSPHSPEQWKVLWLHYQVTKTQAFALPEKSPVRLADEKILRQLLPILAQSPDSNVQMIDSLAQDALALGEVKTALILYKTAAKFPGHNSPEFFAQAGKTALFISDYQDSAEFYLLAMQKSTSIDDQRNYFIAALKSLMAGAKFNDALKFSEKNINGLAKDPTTLIFLAKMALSADKPDVAQRYIKRVLQFKSSETHDVTKEK